MAAIIYISRNQFKVWKENQENVNSKLCVQNTDYDPPNKDEAWQEIFVFLSIKLIRNDLETTNIQVPVILNNDGKDKADCGFIND